MRTWLRIRVVHSGSVWWPPSFWSQLGVRGWVVVHLAGAVIFEAHSDQAYHDNWYYSWGRNKCACNPRVYVYLLDLAKSLDSARKSTTVCYCILISYITWTNDYCYYYSAAFIVPFASAIAYRHTNNTYSFCYPLSHHRDLSWHALNWMQQLKQPKHTSQFWRFGGRLTWPVTVLEEPPLLVTWTSNATNARLLVANTIKFMKYEPKY